MLSTLVEIGPVVLEKIFIDKFHQWFSPIFQLSSIGKGCGPSFSILPKMICTKLDWNWPTDSGKRKCEKCTDSRNSSTHLSAQVSSRWPRISSNSEYQVASFVFLDLNVTNESKSHMKWFNLLVPTDFLLLFIFCARSKLYKASSDPERRSNKIYLYFFMVSLTKLFRTVVPYSLCTYNSLSIFWLKWPRFKIYHYHVIMEELKSWVKINGFLIT